MSDVGDVARAVEVIGKIVFSALHPTQQAQIKAAYEDSQKRVDDYKDALLSNDTDMCERLELGFLFGIQANLGPGEINNLASRDAIGFNQFNQLGWFQRAEGGRFAQSVIAILETNKDTSGS